LGKYDEVKSFSRRTQGNFSGLNNVCKKFTEIVSQTRPEKGSPSRPLLSPLLSPLVSPKASLSTQQSGIFEKKRDP